MSACKGCGEISGLCGCDPDCSCEDCVETRDEIEADLSEKEGEGDE